MIRWNIISYISFVFLQVLYRQTADGIDAYYNAIPLKRGRVALDDHRTSRRHMQLPERPVAVCARRRRRLVSTRTKEKEKRDDYIM